MAHRSLCIPCWSATSFGHLDGVPGFAPVLLLRGEAEDGSCMSLSLSVSQTCRQIHLSVKVKIRCSEKGAQRKGEMLPHVAKASTCWGWGLGVDSGQPAGSLGTTCTGHPSQQRSASCCLRRDAFQPGILLPSKPSIKHKHRIKTSSDRERFKKIHAALEFFLRNSLEDLL